jgi:hypothetical protein
VKNVVENVNKPVSVIELLKRGFFSGIGWAFGATVGFVIISTILIYLLGKAGGLPLVGNFLASIVQSTLEQLATRTPVFVQ